MQKKICYLVDTLRPHSGWGRLSREIIDRMPGDEYQVIVLVRVRSGDSRERAVLASGFFGMARSIIRTRAVARNCDAIHAFDGWPNAIIAYFACLFLKKPLYITAVGTYSVFPLGGFVQGPLLRLAYRRAQRIFSISNYTKNEILKRVYLQNIETVNLGVDFEKFHSAYADPVLKKNIILSVGEIKARKGYHIAIEAISRLQKEFPDLQYVVAGSGNNPGSRYFYNLQKMILRYGVEKNIVFLGNISGDELLEWYKKAKIFILSSIETGGAFEGFGLVLLEANSAGIPVIGTMPSGMEDIITNGVNGFLVERGNVTALEKITARLLKDPSLLKDMSNNSIAVARKFSWDRTVAKYRDAYDEALARQ